MCVLGAGVGGGVVSQRQPFGVLFYIDLLKERQIATWNFSFLKYSTSASSQYPDLTCFDVIIWNKRRLMYISILKIFFNSFDTFILSIFLPILFQWNTYEPAHEKRTFRFVVLQMRMRSLLYGRQKCIFAWNFFHVSATCLWKVKALTRLRLCAHSPEPLLVGYVISALFFMRGSYKTISKTHAVCTELKKFTPVRVSSPSVFDEMYTNLCIRANFNPWPL